MTLKKLLIKHRMDISEISALAASIYAGNNNIKQVANSVLRYHSIYTKLMGMRPKNSKFHVRVEWSNEQRYISVNGYKNIPDKESYALEFRPWSEWLGMDVIGTIHDEKKEIAYCLWEMTFMGFDQNTVLKQKKELDRRIEEIESGKAKTIPASDIFKKYKNKKRRNL
jgi:hypothetical protein